MPDLPERPDLDQLRHQARDLLTGAQGGDPAAAARIHAVADRLILASAQLAVARHYGFASWARLKSEVQRREIFNDRDLGRLRALIAEQPDLATARMEHWCDHRGGAEPVGYLAMLRFDARRLGLAPIRSGTGEMVRELLAAGAPVDGEPGAPETPLMTAASYGDADVAQVLVDAGADLEATATPSAGGAPLGTALRHAAVFGMTEVVDLLVRAGARIGGLDEAAAAGDLSGFDLAGATEPDRVAALRLAAAHERLSVIDALLDAGTAVDALDSDGSTALHEAAYYGRPATVSHLLARGADPALRDRRYDSTPLGWARHQHEEVGDSPGHDQVEAILAGHE